MKFIKSKPYLYKNIKIGNDINIAIGESGPSNFLNIFQKFITTISKPFIKKNMQGTAENNNFGVILYQNNNINSSIVLMNNITKIEAEYIIKKILQLANKYENRLKIGNIKKFSEPIKQNSDNKILILCFLLLFFAGMPFINFGIKLMNSYTSSTSINNPEVLNSNVLRHLGYKEEKIGYGFKKKWKKGGRYITSIDIPATYKYRGNECTIREIEKETFRESESLVSISIPNTVEKIGKSAFHYCHYAQLTIPDNVREIEEWAFADCWSITNVTIPKNLKKIDDYVFFRCTGLTNIIIPDNVNEIGEWAFVECKSLKEVTISDSVTKIEDRAFGHCSKLTSVKLSNNITRIADFTFFRDYKLQDIKIPDSVTEIGEYAFEDCKSLENISIPKNVKKIGKHAFYNCHSLKNVIIPNSVIEIEEDAFVGVKHIEYHGKLKGAPWGAISIN